MSLQLVSLFAGVGGFDIAAERSGIDPIVACEIDPQARGVLQHRFPNTILINDVKDVTGDKLREHGLDPRRTIITGGFPCQDLSIAGKQAGLEGGERSSLFFEIVRILREFNPQWFILENVPGLLSSKRGRDMGVVVGELAELGYSFSWRILDAQNFGVPQRRRRVFIVGHLGADATRVEQVLFESESRRRDTEASGTQGQDIAGNIASSSKPDRKWPPLVSPTVTSKWHKGNGGPAGDEHQNLVPAAVLIHNKQSDGDVRLYDNISPTVTRTWGTGGNNVPMVETNPQRIDVFDTQFGSNAQVFNNISPTLKHSQQSPSVAFPTLRREGNGHAVAFDGYNQTLGLTSQTIRADKNDGDHIGMVLQGSPTTVRRLTPMECERLQGFPDGWSAQRVDHKKGVVVDQADSSRYKQMGNAVAVPVVEWIFNRLVLSEETK